MELYNMNNKRRGTALIINNRDFPTSPELGERVGTGEDAEALKNMLTALEFDIAYEENLTKAGMKAAIDTGNGLL